MNSLPLVLDPVKGSEKEIGEREEDKVRGYHSVWLWGLPQKHALYATAQKSHVSSPSYGTEPSWSLASYIPACTKGFTYMHLFKLPKPSDLYYSCTSLQKRIQMQAEESAHHGHTSRQESGKCPRSRSPSLAFHTHIQQNRYRNRRSQASSRKLEAEFEVLDENQDTPRSPGRCGAAAGRSCRKGPGEAGMKPE